MTEQQEKERTIVDSVMSSVAWLASWLSIERAKLE